MDFVELLRCHWITDTNTFPHERHRVQLLTMFLVAAFTGSRPNALLGIKYRDLDRFVQYDPTRKGARPRTGLIQSANRMSRLIDHRRPKELTEEQSAQIREESEALELRSRRDKMFQRIREQFTLIYRAKGQPIHEDYEKAKSTIDRMIKQREKELMEQIQRDYDVAAPVQDILAQIEGDKDSNIPVSPHPASVRYAFLEQARIAKAFFDPPWAYGAKCGLNWRISIVDDIVSLCPCSRAIKIEPESDFDSSLTYSIPIRCKPYQCLYCQGDVSLPLEERVHILGSKHSLQRHFGRRHLFQPCQNCPFPHDECAQLVLDTLMHFKIHASGVHGIHIQLLGFVTTQFGRFDIHICYRKQDS